MSATIRYLDEGHERLVELGEQPLLVGRISVCAIRVQDGTVTRRHARIYREAGGTWIADLGSDNGTYVNGRRITKPCALEHGDKILCGRLELQYFAS